MSVKLSDTVNGRGADTGPASFLHGLISLCGKISRRLYTKRSEWFRHPVS